MSRAVRYKKHLTTLQVFLSIVLVLLTVCVLVKAFFLKAPEQKAAELPAQSAASDTDSQQSPEEQAAQEALRSHLERKGGFYTILLSGLDDDNGGSDTNILVAVDTVNGYVYGVSIPRDSKAIIDGKARKINYAYNKGGTELLADTVSEQLGIPVDYTVSVNLKGFTALVDAIGGVDYEVPYNMDYDDPTQDLHIHYKKGMQHLNGEDAVKVLRWRKNNSGESLSVGDVGRVEVQHSFLRALAKEMVSLGTLTKIGEIVDIVDRNLESNLDYGEMIWFGERALGLKEGSIRFHNLPGDYTGTMWSPTYQNYQSYVFVNSSALRDLINQYMNPYLEDITPDMQHVVQDTTVNNLPVESDTTAQTGQAAGDAAQGQTTD